MSKLNVLMDGIYFGEGPRWRTGICGFRTSTHMKY